VSRLKTLFPCVLLLWCGSVRAQFTLDREPPGPSSRKTGLVITEIMYNPRPVPGVATNLTHEFIELFNSKPWDEDISGFAIDGTVRYVFPTNTILRAGAYLAVARVPEMIRTNFGVTNVFGPWDGAEMNRLSTETGLVRLRNALGAVLLEVNYADSPPWPEAADGTGHSLSLVRPSWGEDNYQAWAESDSVGGSPGAADPLTLDPLASVFINEWQHHSDPIDWIELYNHSNSEVDLSGAWLSDDPTTNKFRIPDGTSISPQGFIAFDAAQLGFEMFAGGETIFFWNSNQTRVIDVIDFRGQSNNITSGRYPDGGPIIYGLRNPTRDGPNANPMRYGVVISEIMYNPISGSNDDEYIEIYNRGNGPVNLAGWEFVVGISYVFPTNSLTANMPAGAHWVLARNPVNLFSIYSNLNSNNTFGPYSGTLANGGERVVLASADYDIVNQGGSNFTERLNVPVSDVTYGDGGKWGNWSDGQGSSLELIDPEGDGHHPSNWADSNDTGESQWTAIEYNGPLGEALGSPVNDSVIIMLQGPGECLVDEVEVRADNGPNLVANGSFESGLASWTLQGSHDFSTTENEGFASAKSLHVRAGSRGDNQSNRILSAPFASAVPPGTQKVSIRAKVRWLRGHPEVLLRLHGSATEAYGRLALPRKLGTPGATNSTRIANAGPAVYDVKHSPLLPAANEAVVVTARASDRQGIAAMTLQYRVDPTPTYTSVTMRDDGAGADAVGSDGIYSAFIPGQPVGEMVAFYIAGRDGPGAIGTFPHEVFPKPGFTRCWPNDAIVHECVVRWGEAQMPGDFATYHLWVTAVNSNRWHTRDPMNNTPMDGTFIYNNSRVMYNALPLFSGSPFHRTNSTAGPSGVLRVDYEMNFQDDDPLLGATDFVLNNPGNPDILTVSDLSAVNEHTIYKIFEGMGLPNNHRRYIHFFVNGSQRSKAYERTGHFIFEDSQQPNGDMIDEWFPNAAGGQLFKVDDWFEFDNNGFDITANNDADLSRRTVMLSGQPTLLPGPYRFMFRKRSVGVGNSANDYSPIFALINAVSPSDNPTNTVIDPDVFGAVADWEAWMRHFAVQRAVGNFDSYGWERGKNDYLYSGASGFVHMSWDVDYGLGLGKPANTLLFGSNDPRVAAMFNTPAIVRAYWRAFTDLVNGPFSNANLDPFIDARVNALMNNNIDIDLTAVARIKTYISDRRAFLQSQLATVDAPLAIDGPLSFDTTNNLLILTGTAPVAVKTITLNGVNYPMTWLTATSFVMRVVLHGGFNSLSLQGFDRFGAPLLGPIEMVVNYTGPEPQPIGSLVISEIMYASAPGAQFVEIVNRSEQHFDLSGWRLTGANFTFPLGSIVTNGQIIVIAQNSAVFRTAYGSVPIFAVFGANLTRTQTLALVRNSVADDEVIDAVRYEPDSPWANAAPGQSLQLIDLSQDNSRPGNWAVSSSVPATPGAPNSVSAAVQPYAPIWLNEVQPLNFTGPFDNLGEREPWLELYNAGAVAVDLDAYFLANNYATNLMQWPIPPGTALEPGEHRIIWADGEPDESDADHLHTSFRLDYNGRLALVRLVNGQPEIIDYLSWRWPGADVSYGSFPEGQPVFRFSLREPTPSGTNTSRIVPVSINEYLAMNSSGLRDLADNDQEDWFELYNSGNQTIDLSGFYFTDDEANSQKFQVPNNGQYRIAPGGFLLVWADDEATQNRPDRADLHVNFKLGGSGGVISLYAPDGVTLVDTINYGVQTADVSEGRYGDGAHRRYTMIRPTPRNPNGIAGFNSPPRFPVVTNTIITAGLGGTARFIAFDPDGQTLTYTTNVFLPGGILSQGGVYRWNVPIDQPPGNYSMVVTVTDNGTPPFVDEAVVTFTVLSPTGTPPPTITPGPVIHSVLSVNGQAVFTIDTVPGRTYRVFYKDDLGAAAWTQLGPDFVAANPYASISDNVAAPHRFYLVQRVN